MRKFITAQAMATTSRCARLHLIGAACSLSQKSSSLSLRQMSLVVRRQGDSMEVALNEAEWLFTESEALSDEEGCYRILRFPVMEGAHRHCGLMGRVEKS